MRVRLRECLLGAMLAFTVWASAEEVQITVFTLTDGTVVDVLSYASAAQGGAAVLSVTTTAGEKRMLAGLDIVRKELVRKPFSELPEYARGTLAAQRKAEQDWSVRVASEKTEEERRRTEAQVRGAELSAKHDVLRAAMSDEQEARQRCAALWDAEQAAQATVKSAQDAIARSRADYVNVESELQTIRSVPPVPPAERERWRARCARLERRMASAQNQMLDASRNLAVSTEQVNRKAADLAQAKAVLAQAQTRVAEAQRRYDEAREQAMRKPVLSDPAGETIRPVNAPAPAPSGEAPPPARTAKRMVARTIEAGEFIQMADGSLWQIHPEDRAESNRWKMEQEIVVVAGKDPAYTHRLLNSTTGGVAKANRLK